MREGELEVLGEELLDVGALDVVGLLELNNLKNLGVLLARNVGKSGSWDHTWIDLKRERCLAAISW